MSNPHYLPGIQYDVVTSRAPAGIVVDQQARIQMRDGVHLAASIYRPDQPGRYPAIMSLTPYGKDNFDTISGFKQVEGNHIGRIRISDITTFEGPDPAYWVGAGYVVIVLDARGQGQSEGDFLPLTPGEQHDFEDAIAWAAKQPWCDGNIGLHGVSYLAVTQWGVAQHRPPELKAIVPWEAFTDPYLRMYPGGIREVGMERFVFQDIMLPNHNPSGKFCNFPPGMTPDLHPLRDEFWKMQRIAIENIEIPVLLCASFSDQGLHTRESFENFNLVSSNKKWLYSHRQPKWQAYYSDDAVAFQRTFFDRFLKGIENGFENSAPVRLEIHADRFEHKVITSNAWPLPNMEYLPLYVMAGSGKLSASKPHEIASMSYDASEGAAMFEYQFDGDTDIVGNAKLKLWIESIGAEDTDLFVGIKKIDAKGNEVLFYGFGGTNPNDVVARGWLRVSHRELDELASRPDRPVHKHERELKLKPGEIVPVEIELLPSGTTFLKGEKLQVVVQGKAIQPDASLLTFLPSNKGANKIWSGGEYDSHLLIPVMRS